MKLRILLSFFSFLLFTACEKEDTILTSQTRTEVKLNGTWDRVQTITKTYQKNTNTLIGTQTRNYNQGDYDMYDGDNIVEFIDRKMVNTFTYQSLDATHYKVIRNGQSLFTVTVKELTAAKLITYHEIINSAGDKETIETTKTR